MRYTLSQLPHSLPSFRYVNDRSFLLTSSPFIQRGNAGQANQPFCRDGRHTLRQQPRRSVPTTLKFFPFLAAEELRCEVKTGRGEGETAEQSARPGGVRMSSLQQGLGGLSSPMPCDGVVLRVSSRLVCNSDARKRVLCPVHAGNGNVRAQQLATTLYSRPRRVD